MKTWYTDEQQLQPFATWRIAKVPKVPENQPQWLIESLWSEQAVGILGGQPKCAKSLLALHIAVAVATATPCLQRFAVTQRGPVLLFAAEDPNTIVRQRLEAIAQHTGNTFETLAIHLIDANVIRLDDDVHQQRLLYTVAKIQPRLIILDPLVRLHRVDENSATDIAMILSFLRTLQQNFKSAVLLVHHARKSANSRLGQTLRGSSELHAWGDSNLFLRRHRENEIMLSAEHRAAASIDAVQLELKPSCQGAILQPHTAGDRKPFQNRKTPQRIKQVGYQLKAH